MTVKELKELLEKIPDDATVYTNNYAPGREFAYGVWYDKEDNSLEIQ